MAFRSLKEFAILNHVVLQETMGGSVDGVNKTFTVTGTVLGSTIDIYIGSQGGAQLMIGGGVDYTFSAPHTITFTVAPPPNSICLADYLK
ncbi:MAG TPA: hypothetical protein VN922_10420 [Bacteroidia bacterium]|nr:hypothetical protein [Bacteroidia bacterium]